MSKIENITTLPVAETKDKVILPNGSELLYSRTKESSLFIDKLSLLVRTLKNETCLPTEVFFKDQDKEALALTRKYISNIGKLFNVVNEYGSATDFGSYSFRLPHMIELTSWTNIVVRLQFATSLYAIFNALNQNLVEDNSNKWGVLEYDSETKVYSINGVEVKPGSKLDIYTIDEKVISKVVFGEHDIVNCKKEEGVVLPIFHLTKEAQENLSSELLAVKYKAKLGVTDYLLGVDAWSFIQCLLYRVSDDEEEVLQIETNILSQLDYDPGMSVPEYTKLGTKLQEDDLPFGINTILLACLRDYYSKNSESFTKFAKNVYNLYENQDSFRKNIMKQPAFKNPNTIITSIYDLLRLLDGKSKVLKVKLVKFDGTTVDAVTISRPISLTNLGAFIRLNHKMALFQRIRYTEQVKAKSNGFRDLFDKLLNNSATVLKEEDQFVLMDELVASEDIIGYVASSVKAYYFGEDSSLEKDDKFAMFYELTNRFNPILKVK